MAGIGLVAGANQFQFKEKYDALKEADQKQQLAIPNKKLTDTQAKQKDLTDLTTLLGTFKGDISSIVEGDVFSKSKVDATGESASITTKKGVKVGDFDIDVKQLATKDAYQTNSFSSEAYGIFNDVSIINDKGEKEMLKDAEFKITVNKQEFTIRINSGDSIQSLNDKILSATNENGKKLSDYVSTKVLDTGHDNYRLMITSKEAGIDNEIAFGISSKNDDPNVAEFSKAVLKKLGLLNSANASSVKKELKSATEQLDASKVILGDKNYLEDIQKKVSELTADKELSYKISEQDPNDSSKTIEKEVKFTINKDTDLTKLSDDERKAVFNEFKDKTNMEQQTKDWVSFIKNKGEELNVKFKDSSGKEQTVSINKLTDFDKLSNDEKKGLQEFFELQQFNYFDNELDVKSAETRLKAIDTSANHVQTAKDSKFVYEGIEITRSTNNIEDLIIGAKITLKKEGVTNFKVSDDLDALTEHLNTFTTNYNALVNSLATSTGFDQEKKTSGSLQGITEITRLKSQLSSLITKADANGMSLSGMGFSLNEKGILEFKKSKFEEAYKKNGENIKSFLQGSTKYQELNETSKTISQKVALAEGDLKINGKDITFKKEFLDKLNDPKNTITQGEYLNKLVEAINDAKIDGVSAKLGKDGNIIISSTGKNALEIKGSSDKLLQLGLEEKTINTIKTEQTGIFRTFKDTLDGLVGSNGTISKYSQQLEKDVKDLNESIKKINQEIEKKYETLANKLSHYDGILKKYELQGNTINALINSAFANK
ncbi:flagellar filament cap protein [Campylobacter sp. RM5004]|uniref:flagellar filament capping protein FliD n=1 Tax=Campylobacter sp. RM5004 TaxID=1660078 RepID=UPI001EFA51CA|nr:flagellar filament capping protein FliD [Campylobacter sp. RM5004]ULO01909.1 flagellar filament cap protein [Campylobacter sp. RM5004]